MRLRRFASAFAGMALALVAAAALYVIPNANAIIGGQPAGIYLFMTSLQVDGKHVCGGAAITPTWVVTAAYCLVGKSPAQLKVHYGSVGTDSWGVLADVDVQPARDAVPIEIAPRLARWAPRPGSSAGARPAPTAVLVADQRAAPAG